MTRAERRGIREDAYRAARAAAVPVKVAKELAERVLARVVLGGETKQLAIDDELRKAAQ